MYATFVSFEGGDGEMLPGWDWGEAIKKGIGEGLSWRGLVLLDNYLKGATQGSSGADGFALRAPAALFCLDDSDNVVNQHQCVTIAHSDT